jgi:hypothetical protein
MIKVSVERSWAEERTKANVSYDDRTGKDHNQLTRSHSLCY